MVGPWSACLCASLHGYDCVFFLFYTAVVFNPHDTAEALRKNGGFVPGVRPGKNTVEYFDYVLTRLTVVGSLYLVFISVLPELLVAKLAVPLFWRDKPSDCCKCDYGYVCRYTLTS